MIFQEDNQSWFEECKEFLAKDGRVLLVRVCLAGNEYSASNEPLIPLLRATLSGN